MKTRRAAGALVFVMLLSGIGIGRAMADAPIPGQPAGPTVLRYLERGDDGPRIRVVGDGCMQAEDSLELRLKDYEVYRGYEVAVYRCIVP